MFYDLLVMIYNKFNFVFLKFKNKCVYMLVRFIFINKIYIVL